MYVCEREGGKKEDTELRERSQEKREEERGKERRSGREKKRDVKPIRRVPLRPSTKCKPTLLGQPLRTSVNARDHGLAPPSTRESLGSASESGNGVHATVTLRETTLFRKSQQRHEPAISHGRHSPEEGEDWTEGGITEFTITKEAEGRRM